MSNSNSIIGVQILNDEKHPIQIHYGDKVKATSAASGATYQGWFVEVQGPGASRLEGSIFMITEGDYAPVWLGPQSPLEYLGSPGSMPKAASNIAAYYLAYHKQNEELVLANKLRLIAEEAREKQVQIIQDLNKEKEVLCSTLETAREETAKLFRAEFENQMRAALAAAKEDGYEYEAIRIMEAAGITIPDKKTHSVKVKVEGEVEIWVEDWSSHLVPTISQSEVEDAIHSGDGTLTKWEVVSD